LISEELEDEEAMATELGKLDRWSRLDLWIYLFFVKEEVALIP
jgi:hypothetical protein